MITDYKSIDAMFGFEDVYSDVVRSLYKGERLKIVEIGAWLGGSSFYLVETNHDIADIWIVDRWEGTLGGAAHGRPCDQMDKFLKNMEKWTEKFTAIKSDSAAAASNFEDNSLDFVFIDADHSYEAVSADIKAWLPKVKESGIIAGHDYNIYQGVNDAVRDLIGDKIKVMQYSWICNKKDVK